MKQKILLFVQIALLCSLFFIKTNYVLSQETYDLTEVEESSSLSNDEETPDNTGTQLDNDETNTGTNVDSGNTNILENETTEPITENEDNQDTKWLEEWTENNQIQTEIEENIQPSRGVSSTNWDNDKFLNSDFWSQNPNDEDIINAIYWSEWDTSVYTLWWPSLCVNMQVVHVTINNWLPTNLNENTIYVLETDTLFLQWQTLLNNCSAIVSSRNSEFWTKIYSSEAVWSQWILYSNWKNFVIIDNVSIDWYLYWNSTTAITLSFENSTYNTLNNVSLYNSNLTNLSLASNSNYNKINNVHIYNSQRYGISFSSNSNRNTVNNIQVYNNASNTKWYAVYILGWSTQNVFNNALVYNNFYWVYLNQTSNNYFNNTLLYNNLKSWNAWFANNYYYWDRISDWDAAAAWSDLDFPNVDWLWWQDITSSSSFFDTLTTPIDNDWVYMYPRNVMPNDVRWPKSFLDYSNYEYWSEIRVQEQPVAYDWETLVNRWNYNSNLYIWQRLEWSSQTSDFIDPVCEIKYSTTWLTNQDVIAILTWCSEEIADTETSHIFTGNWTYLFVFEDLAWNTNGEWAVVDWIDKTAPICEIEYTTWTTNQNVIATLTWCSKEILEQWATYTFTANGQYLFVFHDVLWNTWEEMAVVDWIITNWWGGWHLSLKKDNCPNWDFSNSYYDGSCWNSNVDTIWQSHWSAPKNPESNEYYEAYKRAYDNWMIDKEYITKKWIKTELTRIEASRLLSNFAINILWMTWDASREKIFNDVSEYLDSLYGNSVSLSYKLWIMWINTPNNEFRPFWIVLRSEFITALSRMLYWTADWTDVYYSTHMNLMKDLWVIKYADPTIRETIWYALIILQKSSDLLTNKS